MHRHQPEPVPAASWPKSKGPWRRIHADFAGPLEGVMYLVVLDAYSKWLEVVPMSANTSAGTIRVLRRIFAAYGYTAAVLSANGPQFVSAEFESFLAKNGVVHLTLAPYYAPTNGLAERTLQKEAFCVEKRNGRPAEESLQEFLRQYRMTPHATTGEAPMKLFLNRDIRTHCILLKPEPEAQQPNVDNTQQEGSNGVRYAVGQKVYARVYNLSHKWEKVVVEKIVGTRSVEVCMETGLLARRHHNQHKRSDSEVLAPPTPMVVAPRPGVRRSIRYRRVPARLQE